MPPRSPSIVPRRLRARRRSGGLAATLFAAVVAAGAPGAGAEAPPLGSLPVPGAPLAALEGVHTDLVEALPPIRQGPALVFLSSPSHRLVLHRSWVHLRPVDDPAPPSGRVPFEGLVVLDVEGEGELVADVAASGLAQRFQDEVDVPRQVLRLSGRVALARGPGGFEIEVLRLDGPLRVRIESALAGRLVEVCDALSIVPLLSLDCSGLAAGLARVEVPLPPPGRVLWVDDETLGAAAAGLLGGSAAPGAGSGR